jgi:hypothetical protein
VNRRHVIPSVGRRGLRPTPEDRDDMKHRRRANRPSRHPEEPKAATKDLW